MNPDLFWIPPPNIPASKPNSLRNVKFSLNRDSLLIQIPKSPVSIANIDFSTEGVFCEKPFKFDKQKRQTIIIFDVFYFLMFLINFNS
jgi:hypothetical protein